MKKSSWYIIRNLSGLTVFTILWLWIVHGWIARFSESNPPIIDWFVFCVLNYVLFAWNRGLLGIVLDYFMGKAVFSKNRVVVLPCKFEITLDEIQCTDSLIWIFPGNVSQQAIRGKISVKDLVSSDVLATLKLIEPEPLLVGIWGRKDGWWSRGTANVRSPIRIHLHEKTLAPITLLIEFDLDWNFIGTRLEHKIPKNRMLEIEIIVKTKA